MEYVIVVIHVKQTDLNNNISYKLQTNINTKLGSYQELSEMR